MTPGSRRRWMWASRRRVAAGASRMLLIIPTLPASVARAYHLSGAGRPRQPPDACMNPGSAGDGRAVGRGGRVDARRGDHPQPGGRARLGARLPPHDALDVGAVEDLVAQQRMGQRVDLVTVVA